MVDIPKGYESLLERPLYGHLATMRPDGGLQVNPSTRINISTKGS